MFPIINHIDDVLPHIAGNDNIVVNRKDDYIVIDYILNTPDTFNNPYDKECRGLLFNADGTIMARRLHKFFNVNERPEALVENLDLSKPHWILEKLDGSMITPMITHGLLTWGSKAGVTFLTPQIEEFVKVNDNYRDFAEFMMMIGYTPIFEWCSRKNRIVIDHPFDRLVLIAIRDTVTGKYQPYDYFDTYKKNYGIEVVNQYLGTVANMQQLAEDIKGMSGIEGFVIRFADGHMVKVKCDEYCRYHRAKDDISREKNVISILINGQADDFKGLLMKEDKETLERFEHDFWIEFSEVAEFKILDILQEVKYRDISRKDFALGYTKLNGHVRAIIFKLFDKPDVTHADVMTEMLEVIKKNINHHDKVRFLWGGLNWDNYRLGLS